VDYNDFLDKKRFKDIPTGITNKPKINDQLFDFQRDIVTWALKRGRACIFADCGLGKTPMQIEWAKHIPGDVLMVAPLAVADQTIQEGVKFGVNGITYSEKGDKKGKYTITNYERLENFNPMDYTGIVLDESSILKSYTGKYRTMLIDRFTSIPFRLACTATPAPNDFMELGNHAEFVGSMTRTEMLSMFFVHDGGETQKWRLKGHAEDEFWQWVASWAVMITKPSDLGYDDGKFKLPELKIHEVVVKNDNIPDGFLFELPAATLQERQQARRTTVATRSEESAKIANADSNIVLVWGDRNAECDTMEKLTFGAVQVAGADDHEIKKERLLGFGKNKYKALVSKPKIAGWGMNWQNCNKMIFNGLSDSYEQFYQAVRRCWRFGQEKPVDVYVVISDLEGAVLENIKRKESQAKEMAEEMVKHMQKINESNIKGISVEKTDYKTDNTHGDGWTAYLMDTVEGHRLLDDESVDFSIFSPPFASLYTYSNSTRDMGNVKDHSEFYEQYLYLIKEQFRVTAPGRLLSFHCMNLPTSKTRDGFIGISDFRGMLIKMYQDEGFIYHSEVVIWKDPVIAMQRTKALGLLHKQVVKDSCMSRQGIPDYLVTMRKPGENKKHVHGEFDHYIGDDPGNIGSGNLSIDIWQRYASPIWMDINPSDTLQHRSARDEKDERHICPLQLQVIHRALQLWTRPGDLVCSPFMGIGSEGYEALKLNRKFIGFELKESYYNQAVKNLQMAVDETKKGLLL